RSASQVHVFADLCNRVGDCLGDGEVADLGGLDLLDVGVDRKRDVGDHLHQALEQIVAGDEIGLRIDLDHGAFAAFDREPDQPVGGDAAGLLGGLGES